MQCEPRGLTALLAGLAMLPAALARADVHPHALFSAGMVLQRDLEAKIWGTADLGEEVTVKFRDQTASAKADENGNWLVRLPSKDAGGPFAMTIAGKNTIELTNVMVGEVWFASGQSNMEMALRQALKPDEEIKAATFPDLRLFTVHRAAAAQPVAHVDGQWSACTPDVAKGFSAVGYFFGRDLQQALHVPVGIVHASWGGSAVESWISPETLAGDPDATVFRDRWNRALAHAPEAMADYRKKLAEWEQETATARSAGQKPPREPLWPFLDKSVLDAEHSASIVDQTVEHYPIAHPSGLYNGMVAPVIPLSIRGVIWYQGESNFTRGDQYRRLFPEMIQDWRTHWRRPDLPFLFVQLPYIGGWIKPDAEPREDWFAEVREAQRLSESVPHTAMIVVTDNTIDNDIHPRNKQLFGLRLANAALAIVYGREVPYRGPEYRSSTVETGSIRVRFDGHGALVAKGGGPLRGFAIAGDDRKFRWADASIDGDSVVVSSPQVAKPLAVRYGWNGSKEWNLFNASDLPASPFRTDDWPLLGSKNK